jgi:exopolysaccharide production protein ExoZ
VQTAGRLSSIQSLRALAVIAVLVRHCHDEFTVGSAGVDLFFVISGFIMVYASRELFGSVKNIGTFVRLRAIRIIPAYWIATIILGFILGMPSIEYLLKSLLLIPDSQAPFLKPGWTLVFEVFFYGLFACFIFLPMRTAITFLSGALIAIVIIGPHMRNPYVHYLSQPILLEFLAGTLAGVGFIEGLRLNRNTSLCIIFAAIILLSLSTILSEKSISGLRVVIWGIPASLLFVGTVFGPRIEAIEVKPIIMLGNISYSLYLTHWFFVATYGVQNPVATFVVSIIFATGFFYAIEKPIVEFLRHWSWRAHFVSRRVPPVPEPLDAVGLAG